jgi:hypothetical protein
VAWEESAVGAEDSSQPGLDERCGSAEEFAAESVDGSISADNDDDSFLVGSADLHGYVEAAAATHLSAMGASLCDESESFLLFTLSLSILDTFRMLIPTKEKPFSQFHNSEH